MKDTKENQKHMVLIFENYFFFKFETYANNKTEKKCKKIV